MFTFLKKKKRGQGKNAVVLCGEGIAHAWLTQNEGQPPTLQSVHYSAIINKAETVSILQKFVQQNNLDNTPVVTTLLISESNLVMLEKPEVTDAELSQAVRWRVKESLPFDVNNAIIDVFEIPGQRERGRTPLVYVTAAEKEFLKQRIQLLEEQNLELEKIDIAEMVMRNISSLLPEDQQGVALLKLDATKGLITLTHESSLYLARNLEVGYDSLASKADTEFNPADINPGEGLALEEGLSPDQQRSFNAIVLEVQRSLDYYESHFAKPAINSLVIAPLPYEIPGMINHLASALGLQVRLLDLNAVLDLPQPVSDEMQANCFYAIGAALDVDESSVSLSAQTSGKQNGVAA